MNTMSRSLLLIMFVSLLASCGGKKQSRSPFNFVADDNGLELRENDQPVYYYRRTPKKSSTGDYVCNNYLHPLYSLEGDTLTEEFPADHPYHTGVFWTWHQLYQDDQSLGDGWVWDGITKEVLSAKTEIDSESAILSLDVLWKSDTLGADNPFMNEYTTITVHPAENGLRKIDFVIMLKALIPGFRLGGSDDVKGYGGLCTRIRMPESLTFTSTGGQVTPRTTQITAGPWMDFSANFGNNPRGKSGLAILCHPSTPNYPAPWILRQVSSMQNIVYPGREPVSIPESKPVVLRYRLIVHKGNHDDVDLNTLQKEYAEIRF